MFSRKMVLIVGVIVLIAVNIIVLSASSRRYTTFGLERIAISFTAPFQELVTRTIRFTRDIWQHYFFLVAAAKQNHVLSTQLNKAIQENNQWHETKLANTRLRNLLDFQKTISERVVAAEVIGKDPSAWFKTVIIDKGKADGLTKGLPVVMPAQHPGRLNSNLMKTHPTGGVPRPGIMKMRPVAGRTCRPFSSAPLMMPRLHPGSAIRSRERK